MEGYLEITLGPMFAGKTNKLIATYRELSSTESVVAINYYMDTRYGENVIASHDGNEIPCIMMDSLEKAWFDESDPNHGVLHAADYILINEAQFFENLYNIVEDMMRYSKAVFLYGLDGDYKQEKFGQILDLIPLCNKIEKLESKCLHCGGKAIFTHRIGSDKSQISIGTDTYIVLCRQCLTKIKMEKVEEIASVD